MDRFDRAIIRELQADSRQPISEIADKVSLSPSATHRRLKALEDNGTIEGYGARLNPDRLNLTLLVFVEISLVSQSRESMEDFETAVRSFPEILECHLVSGNADYLIRVAAHDVHDFNRIHRNCLSRLPNVAAMKSSFSLDTAKEWRGYYIDT